MTDSTWLTNNVVPFLSLLCSIFVVSLQIRLQKRISREELGFSHLHNKICSAIDELSSAHLQILLDTDSVFHGWNDVQEFKRRCIAYGKTLESRNCILVKYDVYIPRYLHNKMLEFINCLDPVNDIIHRLADKPILDEADMSELAQVQREFRRLGWKKHQELVKTFRKWLKVD